MSKKAKQLQLTKAARLFRHAAVSNRSVAEAMLATWPDLLEARSVSGETALHWHAIEGANDAIQWLVSRGARVDTRENSGATPLMHAAQLGHLATCGILLSAGADPTQADDNSDSALHFAARYGHAEICRLLIEAGAKVDSVNQDGERAWDVALPQKRDLIRRLLTSPEKNQSYSNPRSNKSSSSSPR